MTQPYHVAPLGWTPESPNPFTPDGSYGPAWSCFVLRDEDDWQVFNGRPGSQFCGPVPENTDESHLEKQRGSGPYCYIAGRGVMDTKARYETVVNADLFRGHKIYMPLPDGADRESFLGNCWPSLEAKLADFLRYENNHSRKVIVSFPCDIDAANLMDRAFAVTPEQRSVRPDDPRWWVHSTTIENWEKIKACGELRSFARMRRKKGSPRGIGLFVFGEPADYAEYVMLAPTLGIGPEHVVSSQQKGYLITEEDTPYTPGVRLYFDGHRIINDGIAVSDGLHLLKVHDHLPLEPYLVAAIGTNDVDPNGEVEIWTPWTFLNRANQQFVQHLAF